MNIFYLDPDPSVAATYHVDKHVVKMILETAQLLSTAHQLLDGEREGLYKATHKNHPCSKWVRASKSNYQWLYSLFCSLCDEYTFRYGKVHKTDQKMREALSVPPTNITDVGFTPPAQAMPDHCKKEDPIAAYRTYYRLEKKSFASWKKRAVPDWFESESE